MTMVMVMVMIMIMIIITHLHWNICKEGNTDIAVKWYEHNPKTE